MRACTAPSGRATARKGTAAYHPDFGSDYSFVDKASSLMSFGLMGRAT